MYDQEQGINQAQAKTAVAQLGGRGGLREPQAGFFEAGETRREPRG